MTARRWEKYREYLKTGDWHVHSNHVDGESTINQMCAQATKNGLKLIAFTEHVRKNLTYSFDEYRAEIEAARAKYPGLVILGGCETKVLNPQGELDVSEDVLKKCDLVVASFHGFPYGKKEDFINAIYNMLKNPDVDVWGHPATVLRNIPQLTTDDMMEMIRLAKEEWVLIEDSMQEKYSLPKEFSQLLKALVASTSIGSDAHSTREIRSV